MAEEPIFRTVHLKFSDEELDVVDAWQRKKKIRTRSEAIRQLIRCAIDADMLMPEKDDLYLLNEKQGSGFTPSFLKSQPPHQQETDLQRLIREEVARAVAEALKGRR